MNIYIALLQSLGIAGIVTSGIVWLLKKGMEAFFKNRSDDYKHELNLSLEEHKSSLETQYAKASKLHEKRLTIISEFYQLIARLDNHMSDMTQYVKWSSGDVENEEKKRMKEASKAYNGFINFYSEHKIFFHLDTCKLIDSMRKLFLESYQSYTATTRFNIQDFDIKDANAKKSFEIIQERIPPILQLLENDFRNEIGLLDKKIK